jgi:two-component system, cell cycle response regulator DivK
MPVEMVRAPSPAAWSGRSRQTADRRLGKHRSVEMKKILIVEDVELNRDLLTQLLEDEYGLVFAGDGAAGITTAASERPELILMDLSLPVVDGWEATRRIKADPVTRQIPVIALTAHAMSNDEEKAKAAGCDDFLTKPVDEDLLFAKLRRWLG